MNVTLTQATTLAVLCLAGATPRAAISASYSPQNGELTVVGDAEDDKIVISRDPNGDILINNGEVAVAGGSPNVQNTTRIQVLAGPGDDVVRFDESGGPLPAGVLHGNEGNDIIIAGSGNDFLFGENGNDILISGDGNDVLLGGDDDDVLAGGTGYDVLLGDRGNDTVNGDEGDDLVIWNLGDGADRINCGRGRDIAQFNGSAGNDDFEIKPGVSPFPGFLGGVTVASADVTGAETIDINTLGGNDTVTGTSGLGALASLDIDGGIGIDILTGGDGNDTVRGGEGNDILFGGLGNDVLLGEEGLDRADGGAGRDVAFGCEYTTNVEMTGRQQAVSTPVTAK